MKSVLFVLCLSLGSLFSVNACAQSNGPMGVERIARFTPLGYQSNTAKSNNTVKWVQVDLGQSHRIDSVKLYPYLAGYDIQPKGFPLKFKITASDDSDFKKFSTIVDFTFTRADYPDPYDAVQIFHAKNIIRGRYVRVTATVLRQNVLALSKLSVYAEGKDVARGCAISDADHGFLGRTPLTRKPRPQGEGDITDNPQNVIPESRWHPVAYKARAPLTGVVLDDGLFKTTMDNNISYLLHYFSADYLLRPFRRRAGKTITDTLPPPDPFWDVSLAGSNAGHFLMGAGNTVRWINNPELHQRMDKIVNGIADCRESDGYIMAYPKNSIFYSERGAYTRSWLTRGLIAAGYSGDSTAFQLLRGYYNWFDSCRYLPELLRRAGQGVQGMIANTRMYFTPVGRPRDIQVVQQYFQEDYWLNELSKQEPKAIWLYPYDHPHCYLITSLEPYLDMYRATGDLRYLKASLGGWNLFHDDWEHVGGSIAICEGKKYPPKSYYLHKQTGELCCSVFWIRYNQRFHLLFPDQEKYVNEIEKSIYNIGLANQDGKNGMRYHADLIGVKEVGTHINTCCEGQGTRLYGSLPEYIYSIAKDGLYVNLFAGSSITWNQDGQPLEVHMITQFPYDKHVKLQFRLAHRVKTKMHIRVPSWAASDMPVFVNGKKIATGKPGTYLLLDRTWSDGDIISFTLPVTFKVIPYRGMDEIGKDHDHYALTYGPILMALVGHVDKSGKALITLSPKEITKHLIPEPGQPLHFIIKGDKEHEYIPYYQVKDDEYFTCYPRIEL